MSILIEEEKRPIPWFPILIGLLILGAISGATYYLFFAAQPGIEVVLSPALRSVNNIADQLDKFEPSLITTSDEFKALRVYTGPPTVGEIGKANPFMP